PLQFSERSDPRPFVPAPLPDAEWLPQIDTINQVLGQAPAIVPPLRDADHACAQCRTITVPSLSILTAEDQWMNTEIRLPALKQLLLVKMTEEEAPEMIDRHIEYYFKTRDGSRSVHLPSKFVRHFMKWR